MNGIIGSWNQGAEQLYGYSAEEIIGKPVSVLVPANRQDEFPEINPPLEGSTMADQWFFAWDGQQFGPFSAVRLKELGGRGTC